MKKITLLYAIFLSNLFIFVACNDTQVKKTIAVTDDITTLRELTKNWNDCLVKRDLEHLGTFYSDKVSIYGASLSKEQVTKIKESFLKKYTDFNQSIAGDIGVTKVNDSQYKVFFPKSSTYSGKTNTVQAFLVFDKTADAWKISTESDDVTDKNLLLKKHKRKNAPETCTDIVLEILMTAPSFIKMTTGLKERIVKNGGTSYGIMLEGSPDPEQDEAQTYSKTYDFNLHESYSDHAPVIARFSFNALEKQLYEYNVVEDNLVPIEFNKRLLIKFNQTCDERMAKKLSQK